MSEPILFLKNATVYQEDKAVLSNVTISLEKGALV